MFKSAIMFFALVFQTNLMAQSSQFFPLSARSCSLGRTGNIIAQDGSALFYNPAALGIANAVWDGGLFSYSHSSMLLAPHNVFSFTMQSNLFPDMGFAAYSSHVESVYASTVLTSDGEIIAGANIIESDRHIAIGAGYHFMSTDQFDHALGLTIKYYQHRFTFDGSNSDVIAFTAGYTLKYRKCLTYTISLRNAGPVIWNESDDLRDMREPFALSSGIGYCNTYYLDDIPLLQLSTEVLFVKDITNLKKTDDNVINQPASDGVFDAAALQSGIELFWLKTLALRGGNISYLSSPPITGNVFSWGVGIRIFNHLSFDVYKEFYLKENFYSSNGFAFSLERLLNWGKDDLKWWRN